MIQNKFTFQSENLVVDYISFNIQDYIQSAYIQKIASYLFESFGFNSTFTKDDPNQGWKEETIFYDDQNPYKVLFRQFDYNPKIKSFWEGTQVIFAGKNANQFYKQIKNSKWHWNIFDLTKTNLGRIDLHYFREFKVIDQNDLVENFMEKCCQRIDIKSKRRKANWNLESNSLVLKIGHRSSSNYYRVYQKQNGNVRKADEAEALFTSGIFIFHIFKKKIHKNKLIKGIIEVEDYAAYFDLYFPS